MQKRELGSASKANYVIMTLQLTMTNERYGECTIMSKIIAEHIKAGFIFGDITAGEYVYLPGGEIGVEEPLCVLETHQSRRDVSLQEAVELIGKLSLKQVRHPLLGFRSC